MEACKNVFFFKKGHFNCNIFLKVGLNDCFLFTRYGTGKFFKPHFDGHYKNSRNQISIFSVTVYLNDVEEGQGGNLIFYKGTRADPAEIGRWRPKKGFFNFLF